MQVKLVLHIVSEEDAVKRQANVGKDVGKELTERQLVIIDLIDKDSYISAQKKSDKISEMPGKGIVAARTIERDLAVLKELGVLTRIAKICKTCRDLNGSLYLITFVPWSCRSISLTLSVPSTTRALMTKQFAIRS